MDILVKPGCALASFPASLGIEGATILRQSCGVTETMMSVIVGLVIYGIFSWIKFPKWARNLPLWILGIYGLIYVPLNVIYENASELAFLNSKMSKSEWISLISNDQRARFSICASLLVALILSGNGWLSRWEKG